MRKVIDPEIRGAGGKTLMICSTGGHLTELLRIESRVGAHQDSLWVTFDTEQSRQQLAGRRVHHLPYVGPRDLKGTIRALPTLRRVLRREKFDAAISTGAAIATAALPLARLHGVPSTYVESVCRVHGPSTTGTMLEKVPGVDVRTQHPSWAGGRWRSHPSILADFRSEERQSADDPLRVFVTLGTIRGYRFDSIIDAFLATGMASEHTIWQLGETQRTDALPGAVHDYLSPDEFAAAASGADVVISHAGVGTLLELLGMGIFPIQAIRRATRNEHVDDHQLEIAELVNETGIGIAVEGPDLNIDTIRRAATRRIVDGLTAGQPSLVRAAA